MTRLLSCFGTALVFFLPGPSTLAIGGEPAWPQFRGTGGLGVAGEEMKLPVRFGPSKSVLWKASLPPGLSSPCIWGERIFLTGFDKGGQKLETFCLDRKDGMILWRRPAPAAEIEKCFPPNSPATPTPTSDGKSVYVYFGSFGLLA